MGTCDPSRRAVLKIGLSTAAVAALPLGAGAEASRGPVLVVVELAGGNDSLNMVIPFADPAYRAARPGLAIGNGVKLDDRFALHPAMPRLASMWDAGQLAIVHGAGYARASRSHYRSAEVWQTASLDRGQTTGWLGRYLDQNAAVKAAGTAPTPVVLRGEVARLIEPIPDGDFDQRMSAIGKAMAGDARPGIVHVTLDGFDTHVRQAAEQGQLLGQLDRGVGGLFEAMGFQAGRAVVMVYSEFGRKLHENGVGGTDHGSAGVVLIAGPGVRGGHFGGASSLTDLEEGAPGVTTDFRRVYATLLERWLQTPATTVLRGHFEPLSFL